METDEERLTPRRRGWFDLRRRGAGLLAFAAHRISGLGLVVYLYLHLSVLGLLRAGPSQWDAFVRLAKSPLFIALDVLLLGGWLLHGLNGLRLSLLGTGRGLRWQKQMFWAAVLLALALTAWGAARLARL